MSPTGSMLARWRYYQLLIENLGLWQSLFYKLQELRIRFLHPRTPIVLFSKQAKFPIRIRPNTSDHAVFFQVFVHQQYRCLANNSAVDLIIDCGANIGLTAVYLLSQFPSARVVAVEPDPGNCAILKSNLARYYGRHRAVLSAVWSHATGLVLSGAEPGSEWQFRVRMPGNCESPSIMATDIATLLEESGADRISILKIDIEGAESVVFCSNYKSWIGKVDNLVIELHDQESRSIFERAIADENFTLSQHGELTICSRLSPSP
jgi:FkbM family methyltransferase